MSFVNYKYIDEWVLAVVKRFIKTTGNTNELGQLIPKATAALDGSKKSATAQFISAPVLQQRVEKLGSIQAANRIRIRRVESFAFGTHQIVEQLWSFKISPLLLCKLRQLSIFVRLETFGRLLQEKNLWTGPHHGDLIPPC